jgi:hypothetical protein
LRTGPRNPLFVREIHVNFNPGDGSGIVLWFFGSRPRVNRTRRCEPEAVGSFLMLAGSAVYASFPQSGKCLRLR